MKGKTMPKKTVASPAGPDDRRTEMLNYLRLANLLSHWDEYLAKFRKGRYSIERALQFILEEECQAKRENARLLRRHRANIPEMFELQTFPFSRQPKLDRKKIQSLYDGLEFMTKGRNIIWMGPTGCGKTGLATAFLLRAIDAGHRGYFVTFPQLVHELFQSQADRSDQKVLKRYLSYDCLVIDEVGYVEVEPAQVGQFFTLMHQRHKRKTTLITSNLGFSEWSSFLKNKQLTAALIDRLTENSHLFNIKNGKTLRDPLDE
jgi:DNA replication protein DnaC